MTEPIKEPKKDNWPRTEHGTIDWEVVFERPKDGLIALVELSPNAEGLTRISKLIVKSLFSRDNDAETRVRFEREVDEIMVNSNTTENAFALEPRKVLIAALLREIKTNRLLSASFHIARLKENKKLESEADADERRADDPSNPMVAEPYSADTREAPPSPEAAFNMALTEMLAHRMSVLCRNVKQDHLMGRPLPFAVSHAFAERMLTLVRDHMALDMQAACRTFIRQAENQPPTHQVDFITKSMESRQSRQIIWASWQSVWADYTQQRDPPEKPKEEEKKGLLGVFKKQKSQPEWMDDPLTIDEWEDAVAMTKQANTLAAKLWADLTAPSEIFQPPTDDDNKLLMNLFARTPSAMEKQIGAVRQIAEQGGNHAKIFADYQQGKDIDLPLLVAICQRPDLFLDNGMLKDLMRSFPDSMRRERFELVLRYFEDQQ